MIPRANGIILHLLRDALIQSKRQGCLPDSMRTIAMKLLYKYDHEEGKQYPKNYRPIALLSCDYKILSRILQKSLAPHMKYLLYADQFCAENKEISELILFLSANIDHCEQTKKEAALAFLDFEKAFDSVSHEFIFAIMEKMRIPLTFIQWTQLGFKDTEARVILNGHLSDPFPLTGGGRQGDNLFPLLFTLVVQGLAASIRKCGAQGITCHNITSFIKQYADDTTLFIGSQGDWAKYQRAISIFCQASGMQINWSKSYALRLGAWNTSPPMDLSMHCHPELKFMIDGQNERVLGVDLGTNLPHKHAATKLETTMQKVLKTKLRRCNNQIGDTITVNSLLLSIPIYSIRLQYYPHNTLQTIDKWARLFIRDTNYLIRDSQRYASKEHGAIVPLIKLDHLATTLQAKWIYKILHNTSENKRPIFTPFWLSFIPQILNKYECHTLDHLIHADINFHKITVHPTKTLPAFPHQCILNYCSMGFTRKILPTFEEYMNQPVFQNKNITNPQNGKSWNRGTFPSVTKSKLYRVADLFVDFNINTYRLDPQVDSLQHPLNNSHLLNRHFSTPKKQLTFPTHLWNSLINSIPTIWLDTITQGNQNQFQPEEFLVLPHYELPDQITKGDIYQYLADGRLQYYRFQDPLLENGIIIKDGHPRRPNTYDPTHPQGHIPFPTLNTLKRIQTYPLHIDQAIWQVVSFTLPSYSKSQTLQHNILFGLYTHNLFPDIEFKELAKKWRQSFSTIHPDTQEFIHTVQQLNHTIDSKHGLEPIMKSINTALIPSKHKELLWKFINKGIYQGIIAYDYQIRKNCISPSQTHIIIPPFCIYSKLINQVTITPTYQWIFWDSPMAQLVWRWVCIILNQLNLELQITSPYEIPLQFLPNLNHPPTMDILNRQNILTTAMYILYTSERTITGQYQKQELTDLVKLTRWPRQVLSNFIDALQVQIQLAPFYHAELQRKLKIPNRKGKLINKHTARKLAYIPRPIINPQNLTPHQILIYEQTWTTRTDIVSINDGKLSFRLFHTYPP